MKKKIIAAVLMMGIVTSSSLTVCAAPKVMADGTIFDAEYYARMYPDVVAVIGTDADALYQHYVNFGKAEGRQAAGSQRLTDQDVINSYQWDFSGYCGGDKSANWVEVPIQAGSLESEDGKTVGCYDNLQWLFDLDTGTLFVYGKGALWPDGFSSAYSWSFRYPYAPSPNRDDSNAYIAKIDGGNEYVSISELIHHVIFGEGVTSLQQYGFMFRDAVDIQILGKDMQPIRNNMFEYSKHLKYVSIPSGVQIIDADGNPTDGFIRNTSYSTEKQYEVILTIRN